MIGDGRHLHTASLVLFVIQQQQQTGSGQTEEQAPGILLVLGHGPRKQALLYLGGVETHGRYSGWLNAALGNAHYHSQDERKRAKQHTVGEPPMQITIVIVNLSRSW